MRNAAMLIAVLCAAPALAEPKRPSDLEQAKTHFRAGERFFDAGNYDQAIVEYRAAYALVLRPALLFNLGSAYRRKAEATGSPADREVAADYYRRYVEAEPDGKGAAEARAYIAALSASVPVTEPRPIEPAVPEPLPAPASLPPAPPPLAPVPVPPLESRRGIRVAGLVTAGAGVALLAGGVYLGLRARSTADEVSALSSSGRWDQDLYERGQAAQRNMFIVGGVGAAALAAGGVLYFVLGRDPEPGLAVTATGVAVSGRF